MVYHTYAHSHTSTHIDGTLLHSHLSALLTGDRTSLHHVFHVFRGPHGAGATGAATDAAATDANKSVLDRHAHLRRVQLSAGLGPLLAQFLVLFEELGVLLIELGILVLYKLVNFWFIALSSGWIFFWDSFISRLAVARSFLHFLIVFIMRAVLLSVLAASHPFFKASE